MTITEQFYINKDKWPDGPWKNEPDRLSWVDETTGYPCLIRRSPSMTILCGYVAVPKTHPCYGKPYKDIDISIHEGLSFSKKCDGDGEFGICHNTKEEDDVWWIGFECGDVNDVHPMSPQIALLFGENATYKDLKFVIEKTWDLVKQLKGMEK